MNLRDHQAGQFYLEDWTVAGNNKDGSNPDGSNEDGFDPDCPTRSRSSPNGSNGDGIDLNGSSMTCLNPKNYFGLKFHFKRNLTR